MIRILTKKESKANLKELLKFCKDNQTLMWNFMIMVKGIRKEPEDKTLEEKLKKQAKDYKTKSKEGKDK